MTPKQLLLQNKPLAQWWGDITKDDKFQDIIHLANREAIQWAYNHSIDEVRGAARMLDFLEGLAEPEEYAPPFSKPMLDHDFTNRKPNKK